MIERERYEYYVLQVVGLHPSTTETTLYTMGRDGWRVVGVEPGTIYLERKVT